MAIYFGHTTARRILESRMALDLDPAVIRGIQNCLCNKHDVTKVLSKIENPYAQEGFRPSFLDPERESLDLLVSSQNEKRTWKGANCRLMPSGLPSRSFWLLSENVLVARPELCLVLLAADLSLIDTIKVAMSFCGIYHLEGDTTTKTIFDRKPIMTVESALSYLKSANGVPGVATARRALRYTLPNSGSPMETRMALPLYLPRHLGGFGLPRPTMNKAIQLDARAQRILGTQQSICAGDAVWYNPKTKLYIILEYQSAKHHDSEYKYGSDFARALALESMGHTVLLVSKAQLESLAQMTELARRISEAIGQPLPADSLVLPEEDDATAKRGSLRESPESPQGDMQDLDGTIGNARGSDAACESAQDKDGASKEAPKEKPTLLEKRTQLLKDVLD